MNKLVAFRVSSMQIGKEIEEVEYYPLVLPIPQMEPAVEPVAVPIEEPELVPA